MQSLDEAEYHAETSGQQFMCGVGIATYLYIYIYIFGVEDGDAGCLHRNGRSYLPYILKKAVVLRVDYQGFYQPHRIR